MLDTISSSQLVNFEMFDQILNKVLLLFLLFRFCYTAFLDTYVIETRKSATINSLLQKFQSCQITLLATDSLSIQFLSQPSQSMQVFVFPPQKTKDGLSKISKTNKFLTYPVVFGLQYTVKFGTPTCKLAVFTSIQNEWNPIESVHLFQKFFRVDLHNSPIFRSVYCKKQKQIFQRGVVGKKQSLRL